MFKLQKVLAMITLGFAFSSSHAQEAQQRFHNPAENLITGGQPTQSELLQLKDSGVTTIINLRSPGEEVAFNEKEEANALGLEYISLPIAGADDINQENAKKLHTLLEENQNQKVLLHCASGNRVGALLAIRAHTLQGESLSSSLQFGREAGLGSLEDKVKTVINEHH